MTITYYPNWKVSAYTVTNGTRLFPDTFDVRQVRNFQHWKDSLENPKWQYQVGNNENACTVFTAERKELVSKPGGPYFIDYGGTYPYTDTNIKRVEGDYFSHKASMLPYDGSEYDVSTADNQAKAKFLAELKATRTKMAGGVFLGELKQTLAMIRSPAKGLFKALDNHLSRMTSMNKKFRHYRKDLKRKKLDDREDVNSIRRGYLEAIRTEYLNFQFGVKPLINDIRDGTEAYRELIDDHTNDPETANLKGIGKWNNVTQTQTDADYGQGGLFTREINRRSWECIVVMRGKTTSSLSCSAPRDTMDRVIDVLGFGPENWLPTIWELIPGSWLADYFTNIGQILESITTRRDNLAWVNRTVITKRSEYLTATADLNKVKSFFEFSPLHGYSASDLGWALSVTSRVYRAPLTDLLFYPTLDFKYPPAESLKWMNISAVVAGFRNLKPPR